MPLDPIRLIDLLVSPPEEVRQRCGAQIQNGAPLREWDSASVEGNHLAGIYSVRAEHVRRISLPVLGIEQAVLSFQDHGEDAITLATVEGDDGYSYHLFVSVEDGEIVACVGTPVATEK